MYYNLVILVYYISSCPQMDPSKPVMVTGDPERLNEKMAEKDGGITYHRSIVDAMVTTPYRVFDQTVTMVICHRT